MSKRKVFTIIQMVLLGCLIGNMFLPFLGSGSSISMWEYLEELEAIGTYGLQIILLIELLLGILACILQLCGAIKDSKFVYFSAGYYFTSLLSIFIYAVDNERLEYTEFGLWIGLFVSAILIILVLIGNLLSNEHKESVYAKKVNDDRKPIGYDPKTGEPVYAKPTGFDPKTGEPVYEKPKGFDPKTGEPIYEKPKGYDPKTGEPIYAKPKGYDPKTGEPIYEE